MQIADVWDHFKIKLPITENLVQAAIHLVIECDVTSVIIQPLCELET